MDALECLKTRRSIRKYKDTPVPQEIIDDIIDCAMKAPSAMDTQPWIFIVVKDPEIRKAISVSKKYASFIQSAPICIVACLDTGKNEIPPSNYISVACAIENLMLAAHAHGLGSCWTYIKNTDDPSVEQRIKDILNIPENIEAIAAIPIGYADQEPRFRRLKEKESILHEEKW
jgi:nitroreductase